MSTTYSFWATPSGSGRLEHVEFGYEDATPSGARNARSRWLAKGAPWFVPDARPVNWDLAAAMRSIPQDFR